MRGIQRDDGIDGRAGLVVRRDAIEVDLHQLPRGQRAGPVRGVNVVHRCFHDIEAQPEGLGGLAASF